MSGLHSFFKRWSFALLMMAVIFAFSSVPANEMPSFSWADAAIKKSGHVVVYSLLALAFWRGFGYKRERLWIAWIFTFLYATLDEFHQSFVPGRNPWWVDVAINSIAAAIALWVALWWREKKNKNG